MNARPRGISLIEIIVVITIISMLMSAIGVYALGIQGKSMVRIAKSDTVNALNALDVYRASTGHYPDPREGFEPVIKSRALKTTPMDPWGHPLTWDLKNGEPVVTSFGADGAPGGTEDDADIVTP